MKNRREFIKSSGLAADGALKRGALQRDDNPFPVKHRQRFNMRGYAAPAIDTVRVAIFGVGNRGSGTVRRLASIENVEIKAICDLEEDRVRRAIDSISESQNPDAYF